MKTLFILLLSIYSTTNRFCQTNYDQGFESGFKEGYCYGDYSCIAPPPPPTPPIRPGEQYENYQDGYNRGFKLGLDNKATSQNNRNVNKGSRGMTSQIVDPVPTYSPMPLNHIEVAFEAALARYNQAKDYRDKLITWIFDLKTKTTEKQFLDAMDYNYQKLRAMDGHDFGEFSEQMDIIKQDIKEEIDKYNTRQREEK